MAKIELLVRPEDRQWFMNYLHLDKTDLLTPFTKRPDGLCVLEFRWIDPAAKTFMCSLPLDPTLWLPFVGRAVGEGGATDWFACDGKMGLTWHTNRYQFPIPLDGFGSTVSLPGSEFWRLTYAAMCARTPATSEGQASPEEEELTTCQHCRCSKLATAMSDDGLCAECQDLRRCTQRDNWDMDDWRDDVRQQNTRLGFEDWVTHQVEYHMDSFKKEQRFDHIPKQCPYCGANGGTHGGKVFSWAINVTSYEKGGREYQGQFKDGLPPEAQDIRLLCDACSEYLNMTGELADEVLVNAGLR